MSQDTETGLISAHATVEIVEGSQVRALGRGVEGTTAT